MNRIGIRELRADLSNQVKRAAAGEPVVITIDGEPKAVISPLVPAQVEMTLDELIAAGRVIPGPRRNEPRPPAPPKVESDRSSAEILDELREDRF
ncbi:MAG: type II toxin-antitoxin system prevent-host-death family antitoxin [Solirubrobacterales bacterium]|nr:type II toxin-antitoxin system prevent-host-death family antitoxin [Solirubrobacterales bacterium]